MNAEDLVYEPIGGKPKLLVDNLLIDSTRKALAGQWNIEFWINTDTAFETYEQISDLIQNDPFTIQYIEQMVEKNPAQRPMNALSIVDIFHTIYNGNDKFYFAGKDLDGHITRQEIQITNWFAIENRLPLLHITNQDYYEWWIAGLMKDFIGYGGYYTFDNEASASTYFGAP